MRPLIIASVITASLALAPAALADDVGISLSTSTPEQGLPVTVTLSGDAGAIDASGDGPFLFAVARPAGGVGCQSSFGADQVAAGDASTVLVDGDEQTAGQPFSEQADFTPDQGGSILCAWLETDGDDGDDVATPNEVTAGPISTSFSASAPQVGPLKVSVPASIRVNQAYDISYGTQTDQDLTLDSIVIPAAAGSCAGSYELELDDVNTPDDIFGGDESVYGTTTTKGIDNESAAGSYTVCAWIEGPDDQQVDAMSATPIKVLGPSSAPAGSSASAPSPSGQPASTGPGVACVVPRWTGTTLATMKKRLVAANCAVGAVHYAKAAHRAKPGRVVKLGDATGTRLRHGAAVSITVARV